MGFGLGMDSYPSQAPQSSFWSPATVSPCPYSKVGLRMDSWEAMAAVSRAVWREPARKDNADTQKEAEAEQQRRLEAGRHSCSPAAPLPFLRPAL